MSKKYFKTLLLILSVFTFFGAAKDASADTHYVRKAGSGSACTEAAPCLTITAGIAAMSSGDTLIIGDGLYEDDRIRSMPSGSAGAYTVIKAENVGGVTVDMSTVTAPWADSALDLNSTRSYIQVEGIKFRGNINHDPNNSNGPFLIQGHHLKVIRCAFYGAIKSGNQAAVVVGGQGLGTHDNLLEECWVWGTGRYKISIYRATNTIVRRCVIRHDWQGGADGFARQEALIANYDSTNTQLQNNILIDSGVPGTYDDADAPNQKENMYGAIWDEKHTTEGGATALTADILAGATTLYFADTQYFGNSGTGFIQNGQYQPLDMFTYTGKTSTTLTGCSSVLAHSSGDLAYPSNDIDKSAKYVGNIILNIKNTSAGHLDKASGTRSFQDNVIWDIGNGGYVSSVDADVRSSAYPPIVTFSNNTIGITGTTANSECTTFGTCGIGAGVNGPGNGSYSMVDSIVYGAATSGISGMISSTYTALFNNVANYGGGASGGIGNSTSINPFINGLSYLPNSTMTLNGHNVGAQIMYQYGAPGTLYGEAGYDTPTIIPLWPFPNEAFIKADFASYDPVATGGGPAGARGFATGTSIDGNSQTLTKYIWEYLGNQIPCDIYGTCSGDSTAPSAPSGLGVM